MQETEMQISDYQRSCAEGVIAMGGSLEEVAHVLARTAPLPTFNGTPPMDMQIVRPLAIDYIDEARSLIQQASL